jgi:hypothetical protein
MLCGQWQRLLDSKQRYAILNLEVEKIARSTERSFSYVPDTVAFDGVLNLLKHGVLEVSDCDDFTYQFR